MNDINLTKLNNAKHTLTQIEKKERRIQDRIVSGKMKEELGDSMLKALYEQFRQCSEIIMKLEKVINDQKQRMNKLLSSMQTEIVAETSDSEKAKYVQETICRIDLTRHTKEKHGKTHRPTGHFVVTYKNGQTELFYYNSYRHEIWDKDMNPIKYEYIERFVSIPLSKYRRKLRF